MHCRIAWKGALPFQGEPVDQKLSFDAQELARVTFQIYQDMFEHQNMRKSLSSLNLMTLQKNSCPYYHRGSFAALLKFIKARIKTDWERMMDALLCLIEEDTTILMGRNYIQELYLHLHCFEVFSIPTFKTGFKHAKTDCLTRGVGAWKDIPPVLCLTLVVQELGSESLPTWKRPSLGLLLCTE